MSDNLIHIKSCLGNQFRRMHIHENSEFNDLMDLFTREYGQKLLAKYENESGQVFNLDSPDSYKQMIQMYHELLRTQKRPTLKIYLEPPNSGTMHPGPIQQPTFLQYAQGQGQNLLHHIQPQPLLDPNYNGISATTQRRLSKNTKNLKVNVDDDKEKTLDSNGLGAAPGQVPFSGQSPFQSQFPNQSQQLIFSQNPTEEQNNPYLVNFYINDFELLDILGKGASAVVRKVRHIPSNQIMAMKTIAIEFMPEMQKQILTELQVLHACKSNSIIQFYGAFFNAGRICICTEYMDLGSLEKVYKLAGSIPEQILGKITVSVIKGLVYLYDNHRVMHRDIKPSNILINSKGEVRLCDFGVSAQLNNSLARTFVGTNAYMAPERMAGEGSEYSIRSDVWSLGLSLVEMATGRFPYPPSDNLNQPPVPLSVLDLFHFVVNEPPPVLSKTFFSPSFSDFCEKCLIKDPTYRPTPKELTNHEFFRLHETQPMDLSFWTQSLLARLGQKT